MTLPRLLSSGSRKLLAGVLLGACTLASAHDYKLGGLEIGHPWARSSAPGQRNGSAYLTLKNGGAGDRLVAVRSPVAEAVEMHTMRMDGDVMRMRELGTVDLAAGATLDFKPGADHLMLIGLKQPLKTGDRFEMTLEFERAGKVMVQVNVEAGTAAHDHGAATPHRH